MDHTDKVIEQWSHTKPELDYFPLQVNGRIERFHHYLQKALLPVFKKYGVSRTEFDMMATLRRNNKALTPTQLHQSLLLTAGAISTRLEHLYQRGLIERQMTNEDRRCCLIHLTDSGVSLIDTALVEYLETEKEFIAALSLEEQKRLVALLKILPC